MNGLTRRELKLLRNLEDARDHHKWAKRLVVAWCVAVTFWLAVIAAVIILNIFMAGAYDMLGWNFLTGFWTMAGGMLLAFSGIEIAWPSFFETQKTLRDARRSHEDALMELS